MKTGDNLRRLARLQERLKVPYPDIQAIGDQQLRHAMKYLERTSARHRVSQDATSDVDHSDIACRKEASL